MADPKVIPLPGWHRGINALDQSATEGQVADALDAPPGDRLVVKDDGSLNTTLADRVVGYFKRLYTAAGFTEPPQGGWSEILSNVEDTLAGECPLPSR